ncbi:VIT domain-containing protein [Fibrobacterota bacterium]
MSKTIFLAAFLIACPVLIHSYSIEEIQGPTCVIYNPVIQAPTGISPGFTRVNVIITDGLAQVEMIQTFTNPFPEESEAVYVFPLPHKGSVHGMSYLYQDTVRKAEIMEKQAAIARYDSIRQAGGQAALLLEQKPNVFQQRLANIAGGDSVKVTISLSVPLKYLDGEFEFAFPTMVAQRYQSGPAKVSADSAFPYTIWNPPEDRLGNRLEINVLLITGCGTMDINSPTHPVAVSDIAPVTQALVQRGTIKAGDVFTLPNRKAVLLAPQSTYPNRDYVLRFKRASTMHDFSLAAYKAPDADTGHFMLNLYPDLGQPEEARPPLEVVMLVDISGSQSGWPIEQEKAIALDIFSRLGPGDRLSLLSFNTSIMYAFDSEFPVEVNAATIATASEFVNNLQAGGGTELLSAIQAALGVPQAGGIERIFIFLTDGFITNEEAIFSAISSHPSDPTIFTFGAGNNLNRYFLDRAAEIGHGFSSPIVVGEDVSAKVNLAWERITAPQLDNIQINFGTGQISDLLLPGSTRLFKGQPYLVLGKYTGGGDLKVTISAVKAGLPVTLAKTVRFSFSDPLSWSVEKIWAREKINRLLFEEYEFGTHKETEIVAVSTRYQVLSPYTAFLASNPLFTEGAAFSTADRSQAAVLPELFIEFDGAGAVEQKISYVIKKSMVTISWNAPLKIKSVQVYDIQGRLVMELAVPEHRPRTGELTWDGRLPDGSLLQPGRYILSFNIPGKTLSRMFIWK